LLPEIIVGALALAVIAGTVLELRQRRQAKRSGNTSRRRAGGSSAVFGVMNEVFHPAASQANIIVEEQREARAPLPSPEDKNLPGAEK
jgi:ABC-type phosphate transport system substrate-binding protein